MTEFKCIKCDGDVWIDGNVKDYIDHLQFYHNVDIKNKEKTFKCPKCPTHIPSSFYTLTDLLYHLKLHVLGYYNSSTSNRICLTCDSMLHAYRTPDNRYYFYCPNGCKVETQFDKVKRMAKFRQKKDDRPKFNLGDLF